MTIVAVPVGSAAAVDRVLDDAVCETYFGGADAWDAATSTCTPRVPIVNFSFAGDSLTIPAGVTLVCVGTMFGSQVGGVLINHGTVVSNCSDAFITGRVDNHGVWESRDRLRINGGTFNNSGTFTQTDPGFVRIDDDGVFFNGCGATYSAQPPILVGTGQFVQQECDADGDGVLDADDLCQGTVLPEPAPPQWKKNRYTADASGDFVDPDGRVLPVTVTDTSGCSGAQIVELLDLPASHERFGITKSELDRFVAESGAW